MNRLALTLLISLMSACGGSQAEEIGVSHSYPTRAVELTLRSPDGQFIDVGDLRGAPTILFIFATFDELSQASLNSVTRFHRLHPEAHIVGIAAQPDAGELIGAYAEALHITFTVGYDPDNNVARGLSGLGEIEAIPMFIAIDSSGFIAAEHVGYASENQLERLLLEAEHVDQAATDSLSDSRSAE